MEPPAFPRLSPMSEEEVERALEVGLAPAPITDARRKAETPVRPCWEGAGPEQVQSQPLDPLCQHLSGGAPRSLPVLAPSHSHTQEVLWAYIPPPTPPPTPHSNKFRHPKTRQSQKLHRVLLLPSPRKEQTLKVQSTVAEVCVRDPQRANSGVVLTQVFSSAGHDKLLG